jgi:hypothetical protein
MFLSFYSLLFCLLCFDAALSSIVSLVLVAFACDDALAFWCYVFSLLRAVATSSSIPMQQNESWPQD